MLTTLLSFIVVIGVVIFVHELGHFLAARSVGIRVEQFSLGYPPKMVGKTIGDTEYCLSWIPLGGYVRMSGMIDEGMQGESSLTGAPWEFSSKNPLQKLWVILAGVIMNFLLAIILYTALTAAQGIPEPADTSVIGLLVPGAPAEQAGLEIGDRILSVDGIATETWEALVTELYARPEQEITITYERAGEITEVGLKTEVMAAEIDGEQRDVGRIGISPELIYRKATASEIALSGVLGTARLLKLTVTSFTKIRSAKQLGGPIMIAKMAGSVARQGIAALLNFIAFISVSIGFLNLLPIPALDGGHAVIIATEGIVRRELPHRAKLAIQQVGMLLLLALIVFVVWNDATRIFDFGWIKRIF